MILPSVWVPNDGISSALVAVELSIGVESPIKTDVRGGGEILPVEIDVGLVVD